MKKIFSLSVASGTLIAALLSLLAAFPELSRLPAYAATGQESFNLGIEAYKKANYKVAAQHFHDAVTNGVDKPNAWLYLGHSYAGMNDRARAISVYRSLANKFPKSAEAVAATNALARIKPPAAAPTKTTSAPGAPAAPAEAAKGSLFIDRITLYPPKFGHQPISSLTESTVKTAVRGLPRHIMKILDDGNATLTIAPNIIDKWPGSGDGMKPGSSDTTMGEEPGRTYGRDIHVYEREQIRGTTQLKEIRPQSEIHDITMHEIGHAIDDISGPLSSDPAFKSAMKLDMNDMPDDVRSKISYYLDPGEACAETTAGLLGKTGRSTELVLQFYPRVKRLIKERLRL